MKTKVFIIILVLFSSLFAQKPVIHFAWLSDTHIGGTATAAVDLGNSVRDINEMENIDFTIISGDITQTGRNIDLRLAKSILDSLKKPYYIIPGNHDCKWSESGATYFPKLWGKDRFVFDFGGIRFIGLHEGPVMRMGDGHFAPEDIRWLDKTLKEIKNGKPVIFITHYPVDNQIDNWFEVLDRLKHYNVQLCLVGHGHANRKLNFEGIPAIMGRSNLRARSPLGGYTITEIKNDTAYFSERIPSAETKDVWAKIALQKRNYLADTTGYERPDFSINKKYPFVKALWRKETNYVIASAPALYKNELVITGNSSGRVFALSLKTGKEKWSFKTGSAVYSSAAIDGERVVFGSSDDNIYCLNARTGKQGWKFTTGASVVGVPVISKGVVYIGGSDGSFRALDLKSGRELWSFNELKDFVETKPLIYDGKVIFGAWDSYLYALNIKDGSLCWKWSNGNKDGMYSPAACWPVASEGKVFIVAPDRYMTALDVKTGKALWRSNNFQVREAIGISEDGKTILTRCMTDTVLAFSAGPELLWAKNFHYGYDIDPSMTIEKEGTSFFGTKNGLVYAFDARTGDQKWVYKAGFGVVNTIAPISNSKIVVSTMDGSIMLLNKEGK